MVGFNYFLDIYTYIYITQIAPYTFYVNKTTVTTDIYIYIYRFSDWVFPTSAIANSIQISCLDPS